MNRMRETNQILLTSNYDSSLLLFCDGAYSQAIATMAAPIHDLVTIVEVEAVRVVVVVVVVVRRRTPIVAIVTIIEERRPDTVARSRKKDAVAVWTSNIITINVMLFRPFPRAFIY